MPLKVLGTELGLRQRVAAACKPRASGRLCGGDGCWRHQARQLAEELLDFELRVNENANLLFGAFRTGTHDDLVVALGLSCLDDPRSRQVSLGPVWSVALACSGAPGPVERREGSCHVERTRPFPLAYLQSSHTPRSRSSRIHVCSAFSTVSGFFRSTGL